MYGYILKNKFELNQKFDEVELINHTFSFAIFFNLNSSIIPTQQKLFPLIQNTKQQQNTIKQNTQQELHIGRNISIEQCNTAGSINTLQTRLPKYLYSNTDHNTYIKMMKYYGFYDDLELMLNTIVLNDKYDEKKIKYFNDYNIKLMQIIIN